MHGLLLHLAIVVHSKVLQQHVLQLVEPVQLAKILLYASDFLLNQSRIKQMEVETAIMEVETAMVEFSRKVGRLVGGSARKHQDVARLLEYLIHVGILVELVKSYFVMLAAYQS